MTQQPLISIVTITYNAAKELPPTMQSVAQQTWKDFEHLIIDGASSDNTLEVARQLGTPQLRIISEPDKGLYDAMNKGLKNARGKYVVFLNAGDAFHSADVLLKYAEACKANADIIYADTVIVDDSRKVIAPRHLSAPGQLTFQSFSKGMLVCHQAFMVKKDLTPMYDTRYRFSADYDWTVKCIQNTQPDRCVNLNIIAIDYLADGTTDKNKWKSLMERFKIMCRHYGVAKTIGRHLSFVQRAIKRKSI
ncbi:MAG: glycosyltransferase [Muribaculaceae bacterium]|nr:glycosyltransferase [Muribaculaceae bacterium]